jgi:serine/threonine protein kinase
MLQASDVYAFGALLYEMYCGQHPWAGLQPAQVVYALVIEKQSLQVSLPIEEFANQIPVANH